MTFLTKLGNIPVITPKFYYLAVPYNHPDPAVREARMEYHDKVDAKLLELGHYTLCPMEKHYKVKHGNIPTDYQYWRRFCRAMLRKCSGLIVIDIEGRETSVGVTDEIQTAYSFDFPVYYTNLG